jgi:hypothetical protein
VCVFTAAFLFGRHPSSLSFGAQLSFRLQTAGKLWQRAHRLAIVLVPKQINKLATLIYGFRCFPYVQSAPKNSGVYQPSFAFMSAAFSGQLKKK